MRQRQKKRRLLLLFYIFLLSYGSLVYANNIIKIDLENIKVTKLNENEISLFEGYKFSDLFSYQFSSNVVNIDLPYVEIPKSPYISLNPHNEIKFLRFSQIASDPIVTRVTVYFTNPANYSVFNKNGLVVVQKNETKFDKSKLKLEGETTKLLSDTLSKNNLETKSPKPPEKPKFDKASSIELTSQPEDGFQPVAQLSTHQQNEKLLRKVSLDIENADIRDILRVIAEKFNLKIIADSGVKGKVSVKAKNMTLKELLGQLLLSNNFQYSLRGDELSVISFEQENNRIAKELMFSDLSLKEALQTLAKMMNVNIIIHESVEDKPVNFYVENLNLDELLDLLVKTNKLQKIEHNQNTFIIMAKEEAKDYKRREYKTFKLVNAKPDEVIKMIQGSKALAEKIDTSNLVINERINALSCYETPENLALIEKIIQNIDEKLKQAVIEVKLLEVSRDSMKELGLNLKSKSISVSDVTRIPTSYPIAAQLDFLESQNKARTLASPKIRAVHGKSASISIGKVYPVPYYRYEVATTTNIYGGYIQPYKEYRDVRVGIRLTVTPEITRDNEIAMDLNIIVDDAEPPNADGQLVRSERSTQTYVRVKDGETVILGGLIKGQNIAKTESPAIINKIPLIKRLFTTSRKSNSETEMIILLTPHLVNLDRFADIKEGENHEIVIK